MNRSSLFFAICIGWVCAAHLQAQEVPFVELKGHTRQVFSAGFSLCGTKIVTASGDRTARIWETASGKELLILEGHISGLHGASFLPDGKRVVTVSIDCVFRIWDVLSGQVLQILPEGNVPRTYGVPGLAVFSPDGKKIVAAGMDIAQGLETRIRIWEADSENEPQRVRRYIYIRGFFCVRRFVLIEEQEEQKPQLFVEVEPFSIPSRDERREDG